MSYRGLLWRAAQFVVPVSLVFTAAIGNQARAASFVVTSTLDIGPGTLRQAIFDANAVPGLDTISFNIPGPAPHTITPLTPLPAVTDPVVIDGTTQPGYIGRPIIELDGSMIGATTDGLRIFPGGSTVRGLVINRFQRGILLTALGGNTIRNNYLGTDVTGTMRFGNFIGVQAESSSPNNIIGGTTGTTPGGSCSGDCNLVSGNDNLSFVKGAIQLDSTGNTVQGNYVGTDVTGTVDLGNTYIGVWSNGANNVIGGTTPAARNVISGNGWSGVTVTAAAVVRGNFIGTNAAGTAALGNDQDGVAIRASGVTIGGTAATTPGGACTGSCNLISGNRATGVILDDPAVSTNDLVIGNFIGTNASGTAAIGNVMAGVFLRGASDRVGGSTTAERNVISGNEAAGVRIVISGSGVQNNVVQGNYIGTDTTGTMSLANMNGVTFEGVNNNTLGSGNVISGNLSSGVSFVPAAGVGLVQASGNFVRGNRIGTTASGTNPLPNGRDGVTITGNGNAIGGVSTGSGNTIAFNTMSGVNVLEGTGNGILSNAIFTNGTLGIDLAPAGPTPNDPGDMDTGANDLQNSPVLNDAESAGGRTYIQGTLNSHPTTTYRLEFFSNAACDPTGFGEGQRFIGSTNVTTDAAGNATFTVSFSGSATFLTATATDPASNTSEFSNCGAVRSGVGPAVSLTLSPKTATNPVGTSHTVTATARDAFGLPVSGVTVRFSVSGAHTASGASATNSNGQATFTYSANTTGTDTISAFADTDGNGIQTPGEPSDTATKTWTAAECHHGDGDGHFKHKDKDGKEHNGHFKFHKKDCDADDRPDVEEDDDDTNDHFRSTSVTSSSFSFDNGLKQLTLVGTGLHNGLPVGFTMIAVDNGGLIPGVFTLILTDGYNVTGDQVDGTLLID